MEELICILKKVMEFKEELSRLQDEFLQKTVEILYGKENKKPGLLKDITKLSPLQEEKKLKRLPVIYEVDESTTFRKGNEKMSVSKTKGRASLKNNRESDGKKAAENIKFPGPQRTLIIKLRRPSSDENIGVKYPFEQTWKKCGGSTPSQERLDSSVDSNTSGDSVEEVPPKEDSVIKIESDDEERRTNAVHHSTKSVEVAELDWNISKGQLRVRIKREKWSTTSGEGNELEEATTVDSPKTTENTTVNKKDREKKEVAPKSIKVETLEEGNDDTASISEESVENALTSKHGAIRKQATPAVIAKLNVNQRENTASSVRNINFNSKQSTSSAEAPFAGKKRAEDFRELETNKWKKLKEKGATNAAQEKAMLEKLKPHPGSSKAKSRMPHPPETKVQLEYSFDMLHEYDSTDDEDRVNCMRPPPPEWSRKGTREANIEGQQFLPTSVVDSFFSSRPMTANLRDIFPDIDNHLFHRNSSGIWTTPIRYSDLPKY